MLEAFLINPPSRGGFKSNPFGVDELAILNPPRRKRAKKGKKKMAKTRKRNSKGRFVKGGSKRRTRKVSTARRVSAPKRRRRTAKKRRSPVTRLRRHAVYATNPRRRRRSYRRNPGIGINTGSIMHTLKEGAMVALGAVAVGNAMAHVPYVNTLTGNTRHAARLGVAVLGGALIAKYFSRDLGKAFAMGGVVATALQVASENFPTLVPLSSTDEMALGMYYATPTPTPALSEYYASGPTVSGQPDGLSFEQDMPERLMQNRF